MNCANRKGVSPAMWVIIALLVALVVAVVVITIFNKSATGAGEQGSTAIGTSGSGLNAEICGSICDTCKKRYPTDCAVHWSAMTGEKCIGYIC